MIKDELLGVAARCIECLAFMEVSQAEQQVNPPFSEHISRAAWLLGAAETLRLANQAPMNLQEKSEYEECLNKMRLLAQADQETEGQLDKEWKQGTSMNLDQVLIFEEQLMALP